MTALEKRLINSPGHAAEVADRAESLLQRIPFEPGWRYLDVGCGTGAAARRIAARYGLEVTGVDIDPAQIQAARTGGEAERTTFVVMDATKLDLPGGGFDIVGSSMTTHHIAGFERALDEMARVLRPGGYLAYSDFLLPSWAAKVGERLLPWFGFPALASLENFASRQRLDRLFVRRRGLEADWIWRKDG